MGSALDSPENRVITGAGKGGTVPPAEYRFRAGVSGNPGGRPAVRTLSKACREVLSQPVPDGSGLTFAEAIAKKLASKALEGDVRAAEELADRSEGRPGQSIDLTVSRLAERFYRMSREELLRYAETGKLPEGMANEFPEPQ
jgi:hypothetical protein